MDTLSKLGFLSAELLLRDSGCMKNIRDMKPVLFS